METLTIRPDQRAVFLMTNLRAIPLVILGILFSLAVFSGVLPFEPMLGFLTLAVVLLIMLSGWTYAIYYCETTKITLDDEKVVYEIGIFSHKSEKIPLPKITDTMLSHTFFQKMLGVCNLSISTAGTIGYEISLANLPMAHTQQFHTSLHSVIHRTEQIKTVVVSQPQVPAQPPEKITPPPVPGEEQPPPRPAQPAAPMTPEEPLHEAPQGMRKSARKRPPRER